MVALRAQGAAARGAARVADAQRNERADSAASTYSLSRTVISPACCRAAMVARATSLANLEQWADGLQYYYYLVHYIIAESSVLVLSTYSYIKRALRL